MPFPTLARIDSEATLIRSLQQENGALRERVEALQAIGGSPTGQSTSSSTSSHQSRFSTFNEQPGPGSGGAALASPSTSGLGSRDRAQQPKHLSLEDIVPYGIAPQRHIVDDFSTIAQESLNVSHVADSQLRGLKYLIRNIGGTSPTLNRKDASGDRNKKRSGSAGPRSWMAKE